jgi:thioredoxin reductase (NADPH)
LEHEKIKFVWNTVVTEVVGKDKVEAVNLKNVETDEETVLETDGVFIFIGHTPNTQIFEGQLELDALGYIKVNNLMETSVEGVYAGGEAADPHFRQVITSAGMGAAAAIQATRYLEAQEA